MTVWKSEREERTGRGRGREDDSSDRPEDSIRCGGCKSGAYEIAIGKRMLKQTATELVDWAGVSAQEQPADWVVRQGRGAGAGGIWSHISSGPAVLYCTVASQHASPTHKYCKKYVLYSTSWTRTDQLIWTTLTLYRTTYRCHSFFDNHPSPYSEYQVLYCISLG